MDCDGTTPQASDHRLRRRARAGEGIRAEVSDHVWRDLLSHGTRRLYDAREVLVRQGDAGSRVAVIQEGRVKITRSEVNGMEAVLAVRGAGELVGEMAAIDGGDSPVTVTALRPCLASLFTASRFIGLLGSGDLVVAMLRYAVSRRREADLIRAELSLLPVSMRLVRLLLRLIESTGSTAGAAVDLDLDMGQEELARAIGASRSQVAATLARLRAEGILSTSRRRIVVHDHASLLAIGAGRVSVR
jgi:CRP/FNR family transcriptional regulator, cyclic AMP receptor protein